MKWILIPFIALAAAVVLMGLIGWTLPAAHVASRRARFRQTPQALYEVLAGPQEWRSGLERIEPIDAVNGRPRWKEHARHSSPVTYELVEATPPLRRVTRIVDENLPYTGAWTFDIAPAPGGATLVITERGEVSNPVFRFLSKFVFGYHKSIDTYFADLAKKFNEPLQVER